MSWTAHDNRPQGDAPFDQASVSEVPPGAAPTPADLAEGEDLPADALAAAAFTSAFEAAA